MGVDAPCPIEVAELEAKNAYARELHARRELYMAWPYGGRAPIVAIDELRRRVYDREEAEKRLIELVRPKEPR